MQVFEFVLLIIVVCAVAKLVEKRMDQKAARTAGEDAARKELDARLRQLEERIQVLERIVTDQRADLHRQFRDLGS